MRTSGMLLRIDVVLAALLITLSLGCEEDDLTLDASVDAELPLPDAEVIDGSNVPDVNVPDPDDDAGADRCTSDSDCIDPFFCDGAITCIAGYCVQAPAIDCPSEHPCRESLRACDCRQPSADGDRFPAPVCNDGTLPDDCDDSNAAIHPGADEICDPGTDEDCDPETFNNTAADGTALDGDNDGDTYVSVLCFNIGADGLPNAGDDCRDTNGSTHPFVSEVCDYEDNDCDGTVDEKLGPDGEPTGIAGGLQLTFYPDMDRDGFGNHDAEPQIACDFLQTPGYVPATIEHDCDDSMREINIYALEICDGVDNDCDGLEDAADDNASPLLEPYDFEGTLVECVADEDDENDADWEITECPAGRKWCTGVVATGCSTDATTIANCGECDRTCTFACGGDACSVTTDIELGADHSCVITDDGRAACWGLGSRGRLGTGGTNTRSIAGEVEIISDATILSVGPNSSCAVNGDDEQLFCWGSNTLGLLGNPDPGDASNEDVADDGFSEVPIPVIAEIFGERGFGDVTSVSVSAEHACAVRRPGSLVCWGSDEAGRLGNNSSGGGSRQFPTRSVRESGQPVANARSVATGGAHSCIITTAGTVECWGDNGYGQLGDPDYFEPLSDVVRPVPGLMNVEALAAGTDHTCALSAGEVLCWGANFFLQLGRESGDDDGVPRVVEGLNEVTELAAGETFTCALDVMGDVWCWGAETFGARGDIEPDDRAEPGQVDIGEVESLAAGATHACAIAEGHTYCWGYNASGQLGNGELSQLPRPIPVPIAPMSTN